MAAYKPFVSSISVGEIELLSSTPALAASLTAAGYKISHFSLSGRRHANAIFVLWESEGEPIFSWPAGFRHNAFLKDLVLWLNEQGVAFRDAFKMDASPSEYMQFLQAQGFCREPFLQVSADTGAWQETSIAPAPTVSNEGASA